MYVLYTFHYVFIESSLTTLPKRFLVLLISVHVGMEEKNKRERERGGGRQIIGSKHPVNHVGHIRMKRKNREGERESGTD